MPQKRKPEVICLLPLQRPVHDWVKRNSIKGQDYLLVKLVRCVGEHITIRAANGKERTFGPHEATWAKHETEVQRNERVIKFTANCIADWVQDRDPLLAEAIRRDQWRASWKGAPVSSKFLTIDPPQPKRRGAAK